MTPHMQAHISSKNYTYEWTLLTASIPSMYLFSFHPNHSSLPTCLMKLAVFMSAFCWVLQCKTTCVHYFLYFASERYQSARQYTKVEITCFPLPTQNLWLKYHTSVFSPTICLKVEMCMLREWIWYAAHQLQHNLYLFFSFHLHLMKLSLFMKCSCTLECSVSFIKSFEPLQEWRMRMMPHGVHPVIYWES